ncbi:hypothetical protein, partial [Nitrosopumilus sp. Nsub]|uniref:hypothetical protein n=1 Tax=Nitrosopumilus sp. Nsub TaxID=1776294 RepID=UPI000AA48A75
LAFVVLNTGFSTTQQAKETIMSGLEESASNVQISGSVAGVYSIASTTGGASGAVEDRLNMISIPLKISSGSNPVNLADEVTQVKVLTNSISYEDVLDKTVSGGAANELTSSTDVSAAIVANTDATGDVLAVGANNVAAPVHAGATAGMIYFTSNSDADSHLEKGENAVLTIVFADGEGPGHNEPIHIELLGEQGAVLSIDRFIPALIAGDTYYDLG